MMKAKEAKSIADDVDMLQRELDACLVDIKKMAKGGCYHWCSWNRLSVDVVHELKYLGYSVRDYGAGMYHLVEWSKPHEGGTTE